MSSRKQAPCQTLSGFEFHIDIILESKGNTNGPDLNMNLFPFPMLLKGRLSNAFDFFVLGNDIQWFDFSIIEVLHS